MAIDAKNATWLKPFEEIRHAVAADGQWSRVLGAPGADLPTCGIHLAVFVEPFLGYLLDGTKTIESRFSITRQAPYEKVCKGDILLVKRSSGPIVGICRVGQVWFYNLDPESWSYIREHFARAICAQDPEFWKARESASYATLLQVKNVLSVEPVNWPKRSRQGWVVVSPGTAPDGGDES
ncbi:Marine sediment metagenome DNA, contig: S03H2_S05381 (Fragment) OS=marine sediment metagenome GN=S03H2_35639 PE=4 SV=1 [Gemmata massiliana]|uniref:Marine sediment metagenome DNA, contig: S03H2_S05381 n=1 Tax=Gemmata massiliana TaxID=1210884 RepID=A0A6P2CWK6_9BACT